MEPGALRAELCLGGQGTAEGALLLPSLPSDRAFAAGALGSVQPTSPYALLKDAWDLRAKARQG